MTFRILIVDDEPAIHEVMLVYLKRFLDDFELLVASTGQEAIEKASKLLDEGLPPDIVLMDMKMPTMDGIECTQKLSEIGVKNIHLLTAYFDPDAAKQAAEVGAKGVMRKSEGFVSVARKVADMIRGTKEPTTQTSAS
ncbi:MAG: response regulator [Candidatus Thorarchaeota archaeon]|jgi:CheY-like chemotaxis protein